MWVGGGGGHLTGFKKNIYIYCYRDITDDAMQVLIFYDNNVGVGTTVCGCVGASFCVQVMVTGGGGGAKWRVNDCARYMMFRDDV